MTNIIVTCKCGRLLTLKSTEKWKVREISVVCSCGIGLIINANGTSENNYDISNPVREPERKPA